MANEIITKNEWFIDPSTPMRDMAQMLVNLDNKGLIPAEMRQAIHSHANNAKDILPMGIAAISQAIASAHSGFGLSSVDASQANWAVAALAEKLSATIVLEDQFSEPVHPFYKEAQSAKKEVAHA